MKIAVVILSALLALFARASVDVGFVGPAANGPDTRLVRQGGTTSQLFTSGGFQWEANLDGDSSPSSAVYLYRGVGQLVNHTLNGQYMVDAPGDSTEKGVVWLDGSQGRGTSRGGLGFDLGPFVALSLLGLNAGQTYTLNFE